MNISKYKIIAVGGVPAVGKSSIILKFFDNKSKWRKFKFGLVRGHYNTEDKFMVIGKYLNNKKFQGTDLLSMAVYEDFKKFIQKKYDYHIIFEGDRLFTKSILEFIEKIDNLYVVIIHSKFTEDRHKKRGDTQTEKFIKGRETKIKNISKLKFKNGITYLKNDCKEDLSLNYSSLIKIINSKYEVL